MATQTKLYLVWAAVAVFIAITNAEDVDYIAEDDVIDDSISNLYDRIADTLNGAADGLGEKDALEYHRSLLGSLLGSVAVNSPQTQGLFPTLFPTLFPVPAASAGTLNTGILGTLFANNNIKLQLLQAEADFLRLNLTNAVLSQSTSQLASWKELCKAPLGTITLKNFTTGVYYFETSTASTNIKSWIGARNFCRSKGMDLLTIQDAVEEKVISDELLNIVKAATVDSADNMFWIGLNTLDSISPRYVWDGAINHPVSYTNWQSGEPSTAATDVCVMDKQSNGVFKWDSTACATAARFVCEMPEPCSTILRA